MKPATTIYFTVQIDCEATQHAINDARLGERAIRGLGKIFNTTGIRATFMVIPSDLKAHARIYRELEREGHEIGLHIHPADQGYEEFLGIYGSEDQAKIVGEARNMFADLMGQLPLAFTPGYASANDHTYPVLENLGFRHGLVSIPTRNIPQCACVWGNSPRGAHYPHRYNRCLPGDVDFVEVPGTIDPESRMWGGGHPQDLRIELVDAKNHWYTIFKDVTRQLAASDAIPVKYIKALTHNVFDYLDTRNFRRETLLGVIEAAQNICADKGCRMRPATTGEIAAAYRKKVPLTKSGVKLELDTRGRAVRGRPGKTGR